MSRRVIISMLVLSVVLLSGLLMAGWPGQTVKIDKYDVVDRPARIYPDYSSAVIPPNIAPLNFMVKEEGSHYLAKIYSQNGNAFEVSSSSAKIQIPEDKWHELLEKNRGNELHFDIFVKAKNQAWLRFGTITNKIANEDIDGYLVYRRLHPTYFLMRGRLGIYQRNLGSFVEKVVLDNRRNQRTAGCINCHSFCKNSPDKVLLGIRDTQRGNKTLLIEKNPFGQAEVSKLNAKFIYTSWHPSGKLAAYAIHNMFLVFHTAREEVRDSVDANSAIAYFVDDSKTVRMASATSRSEILETWPAWSADGKYLYFCSSPMLWTAQSLKKGPPERYREVKYDLVRVSYDIEQDKWGQPETVLSGANIGRSIAIPRTSPDGRWLSFCMCDYGFFPPWQTSSDLGIIDLKKGGETGKFEYRRLDISSEKSESWHTWSSNSRWIVFSSKRDNGVFTRSYISYIDENGKAYKPLVIPQKDPQFYEYTLETFNTPELITGPIAVTGERLARAARGSDEISVNMPITMATPKPKNDNEWQEVHNE